LKLGISSLGHLVDNTIAGKYEPLIDLLIDSTEACLKFSEENGINICEIILDPPEISTHKNKKRFIDLCNSFSIQKQIHGPFLDISMCSHNLMISKASVESYIEAAKICVEIGADILTIHPGVVKVPIDSIRTYNEKQLARSVNELLDATVNLVVSVCIENVPKDTGILLNQKEIEEFFSALNREDLFFTYDTSHFWTNEGDVDFLWKKFQKRIKNVHLAENFDRETDMHPPLGTGKVDFRRIFEIARKYEYDGAMVIETYSAKDLPQSLEFIDHLLGR
jgi:sugar phosphate isomerase/epimerase